MESIDLLISPEWIVPIVPHNTVLENHSLAIKDGRIIDILFTPKALQIYHPQEHIRRPEHVLMPGLINCHTHTPMNLFRGLADDLKLMDWLNNHIWPAEKNIINAQSVEDGCRLAIAEMLRGGTTYFNDHYFYPNVLANTAISEGMRASIGFVILNVPTAWAKDEEEYIAKSKKFYAERPLHPLINWTVAPHATYTNSDRSLQKAKDFADEYQLRIHMHLHETQEEIKLDVEKYHKRSIQRLYDLGILCDRLLAVHMVHLSEKELQLVKECGVHVIHNPKSNAKLACGFAPILQMLHLGINVGLGTDSAASNNSLDMFSELRAASLFAKAASGNPTALPAAQALELATINNAKALGLEKELGSIEKGKLADVICIDLSSYLTQPLYNPISHLAYAVNRLEVSDVWIAGKQLLNKGEFTKLDIERVLANAKRWAQKADSFKSRASTMEVIA